MDQQTARAIEGDRRATRAMLERVARGEFDAEVRAWLQHVAHALLDAESKDAGILRDRAIVRALGLAGTEDKHRELRQLLQTEQLLPPLDPKGKPLPVGRADLIKAARTSSTLGHDPKGFKDKKGNELTDAELGKLIDRELKKPS